MRNTISLLLILISISALSQRVSFDDPDLTFSFKKPKNWQVFDDGYYVKVSPSVTDSSSTYFTITYFENPEPYGNDLSLGLGDPNSVDNLEIASFTIVKETVKLEELVEANSKQTTYFFSKYGQNFVVKTSVPKDQKKTNRLILKMIRSILVTQAK